MFGRSTEDCFKLIEKMYFDFGCQFNPYKFEIGCRVRSSINGLEGLVIKRYRAKDMANRNCYHVENDYDKVYELFSEQRNEVNITIGDDHLIKL